MSRRLTLFQGGKPADEPRIPRLDVAGREHDYGPKTPLPDMVALALPIVFRFAGRAIQAAPEGRARTQVEGALEVCLAHFSKPADDCDPHGIPR